MTERDLFLAALDIENPGDRVRFLAEQCAGDPAKLQRLQQLLLAKSAAGEFLEAPAAGLPEVEAVDDTSTFGKPADTFNTQSMIGGALLGQQKYADAEPLLRDGFAGMKQREKAVPPTSAKSFAEALDRLIDLCVATNKEGESKKWQAERAKYPPKQPSAK